MNIKNGKISIFVRKIKKADKNYIIMLILACILMIPILNDKMIMGHDLEFHYFNIQKTMENIDVLEGKIVPSKIMQDIGNGFGYGKGIFYPAMAHTIIAYIGYFLNTCAYNAIKVAIFLIIYLSAVAMYKLVKYVFFSKQAALLSAAIYITYPYFISDLFVRLALAESLIFIFLPLVLLGTVKLIYEKKTFLFIIAATGMIYSHSVTTMFTVIFMSIFVLIYIKDIFKIPVILAFLKAAAIIVIFTLPYLTLMYEHNQYGDYRVFEDSIMGSAEMANDEALSLSNYILPSTDMDGIQCYTPLLLLVLFLITIIKQRKILVDFRRKKFFIGIFLIALLGGVFSSKLINWEYLPDVFTLLQFPWRLVSFMGLSISIMAGISIIYFADKKMKPIVIAGIILLGIIYSYITAFSSIDYDRIRKPEGLVFKHAMGWQLEYLPIAMYENIGYFNSRSSDVVIEDGMANVEIITDDAPYLMIEIEEGELNTVLELPRIHYLGYEITYITDNGVEKLKYKENDNGFISVKLTNKEGIMEVKYKGTFLYNAALICSSVTAVVIIIINLVLYIISKKTKYLE